ncbi:MAG: hypothetical protein IKU01_01500 [Bacteroidales bacterium]|nr:hypothetical protein [Bacteroidales bacterium]
MDKETILDYATNTPENTNRNVLGSMVDSLLRENSGDRLPDVTADDNGDILTVIDGAWAKAEPAGGIITLYAVSPEESDPAMAEFPHYSQSDWTNLAESGLSTTENGTAMTYSELKELIESGVRVQIYVQEYDYYKAILYPDVAEISTVPNESNLITASYKADDYVFGVAFRVGGVT